MKNYFIIHGTNSDQYNNWFPWLYKKLIDKGEECIVPQFPINEHQSYKTWKTILKGYYDSGIINEDTIFVCHGLGCVFITRFVVEMRIKISGIISVCGFNSEGLNEEINNLNQSFLTKDKVLAKISNFVKFYHCIYSDNDEYLSIEDLMRFAKIVNAKVHEIENAGHLNSESGYNEFPFLWDLLDKINTIV